ncbi:MULTISPECIES: DUF4912 domain-containing protein [Prochlorococcus]|uniref:Uncharacterized conserved protein n=1 Tax=Prochlorococcus marinus (strain SARG / CCMP1375 / SS120) TaxID=167539 RepID=Q7VEC5_PROMA|nr:MULTISPECIES: DUF4912 domain-containing protein [Prochlorococcus]AAP99134.1 Uncharacterized conserved protein [Prochlorococcus marinus subsp. marinus str. CCMP1375]KGG11597.1 hypothetical protein EV04_1124 [Prochlorococcus marinus str. LG]KGG35453.1 hypothetical protein EV11_1403 [Prochlorococcus sp. SS52]
MAQDKESLSRLTLRQLRIQASELRIPLYSRKSKASLIKEISLFKEREQTDRKLISFSGLNPLKRKKDSFDSASTEQTRVVFLPRDPDWAYVFWTISEADRQRAQSQGASRLCLRLSDVTGIQNGGQYAGTLREVIVDSHSTEWYLPIPVGDRDYKVELGYRFGAQWISLSFSSVARVPSLRPSEQVLDQFVPFSLDAPSSNDVVEEEKNLLTDQRESDLHERLYQTATTHFRKSRIGSEEFQERTGHDEVINESGSGLWASGRNESGLGGIEQRERSFWLIADAELIVYGSTDPSAKLSIGGEEVPLASDGTFRLQVPFRDGVQNYLIEATDVMGEQKRNINMKFERVTPQDNTNPIDKAKSEWF